MSRKGTTKIRLVQPDRVHQNPIIAKIINRTMKDGRKAAAEKQVYAALAILQKENEKESAVAILESALENIRPKVEVRPRRIGGAVYQVPTPVKSNRQSSLAIHWLIDSARKRPSNQYHSFADKLAAELIAALKNEGAAVTKRTDVERMADANKAFAHLRW